MDLTSVAILSIFTILLHIEEENHISRHFSSISYPMQIHIFRVIIIQISDGASWWLIMQARLAQNLNFLSIYLKNLAQILKKSWNNWHTFLSPCEMQGVISEKSYHIYNLITNFPIFDYKFSIFDYKIMKNFHNWWEFDY